MATVLSRQVSTWGRKVGRSRYVWRMLQRQFVKRVLRRDLQLRLPNGHSVWLPRESQFSSVAWVTQGLVDDGGETILRYLHPANAAFCDIGAHFGFYAVWMADRATAVYAFEPDPRLLRPLQRNLAGLAHAQVIPAAVTRESGSVTFIQAESAPHSKIDGGENGALEPRGQAIAVPAVTLDDFWSGAGRPMIGSLKIDTEGHEAAVFEGGAQCLQHCCPLILVETDAVQLCSYWPQFARLGYRLGLLSEKQAGRRTECWFGLPDRVPLTSAMLFLVPPWIPEAEFRAQVDRL